MRLEKRTGGVRGASKAAWAALERGDLEGLTDHAFALRRLGGRKRTQTAAVEALSRLSLAARGNVGASIILELAAVGEVRRDDLRITLVG